MSRMKLHQSVRLGAYEIYPIYELNFTELKELTGYTLIESSDNVSPNANKFRQWSLINNDIPSHTDSFPRKPTENGNILPCDTRYNNLINDRYYMPHDTIASFAAIEQGVRPDDWGVNPNYITFNNITQGFSDSPGGGYGNVNVCIPEPVNIYDTWDASTSYYEDTQRFLVRKFFLEDGKSFAVSKAGYYNSNRWRGISFGNGTLTSFRSGWNGYDNRYVGYYFTRSDGTVIDRDYRTEYAYGITGIESTADNDWPMWQNGKNITQFFVHYVENGTTDFYGIAMAQMDNFLETASPIALEVVAFDAQWWGASIIAGGGGSGQWTTDGPTSYVQGGSGSFQAPSDNHGDADGTSTGTIANNWSAKGMAYSEGYNKYLIPLRETDPGVFKAPAFKEMVQNLTDPSFLQGFRNLMYNPISAVITCSLIPRSFAPAIVGVDYIHAAGLDLTAENTANIYEQTYKRVHIGSVSVDTFTDSFTDFDNTAVYIHLPYVGNFQLDTAAVMDGELSVDYLIDYFTNDITAIVWTRDRFGSYNYRYEWKGNCGKPMPLTQINTMSSKMAAAMIPTVVGLGVGTVAGAVSGLAAGVATGVNYAKGAAGFIMPSSAGSVAGGVARSALQGFGSGFANKFGSTMSGLVGQQSLVGTAVSASQALTSGQSILSSNANGGSVSSPVNTQCYLAIVRPMWSAPEEYAKQFGYPSDISGTINVSDTEGGDPFTNFLSVRSILLDGLSCLPQEKVEIESLMKAGVYVSND